MSEARLERLVTRQAERRPDRVAIVDADRSIRYGELEQTSARLARELAGAGSGRGERVALLMPKSIEAIVAMLATMRTGGSYVPIDPDSPPARIQKVLESCEPVVLLAGGAAVGKTLSETVLRPGQAVGWIDPENPCPLDPGRIRITAEALSHGSDWPPAAGQSDEEAAHILFTSGSTGQPKGVVIPHRSVLRFVSWANGYFGLGPDDRNSGHSPLFFDLSTYDIFGTFEAGAELYLVPPQLNLLPNKLAEFIRERGLTQWFSVPSILNYMAKFDVVREGDFPQLERLLWCGEVFPTPALRYWMQRLPHVTFTNLYGPTEATIASSYFTVQSCPEDDRAEVPIGIPCAGEELLVLNEQLAPVPAGEIGDLYIAGEGLCAGYWRDSERTAEAFPERVDADGRRQRIYKTGDLAIAGEDGLFFYKGRADSQIKSRGYRIELGEIETALVSIEGVSEGAIVAVPTEGFEGHAICCAFVPDGADELTPAKLRKRLLELVPSYMLPSRWQSLERLPRTANNKIDRKRLRERFAADGRGAPR